MGRSPSPQPDGWPAGPSGTGTGAGVLPCRAGQSSRGPASRTSVAEIRPVSCGDISAPFPLCDSILGPDTCARKWTMTWKSLPETGQEACTRGLLPATLLLPRPSRPFRLFLDEPLDLSLIPRALPAAFLPPSPSQPPPPRGSSPKTTSQGDTLERWGPRIDGSVSADALVTPEGRSPPLWPCRHLGPDRSALWGLTALYLVG